jgi:hypothetical protein
MGLKVDIKSGRSNFYELNVRAAIRESVQYAEDLADVRRGIQYKIDCMRKMSTGAASVFYKVEELPGKVEVWHLNIHGEKDRLTAVITND